MIEEIKGLGFFTALKKENYFYWKFKLVYEASGLQNLKRLSYSMPYWPWHIMNSIFLS